MKKLLLVFPITALLAAGCNSSISQSKTGQSLPVQPSQSAQSQLQSVQNSDNSTTTNTQAVTQPQSDIADWKTYTSIKYGYQLKYPSDWYFESGDTDGSDPHLTNASGDSTEKDQVTVEIQGSHTKDANVDLLTYLKSLSGSSGSRVSLDGANLVKEVINIGPLQGVPIYDIDIDSTHYVSAIIYAAPNIDISVAERIISTIMPTAASANLQTYNGSGFTFQYPKSWQINYTNYPSKNPTSCGDPNGDALLCAAFAPSSVAISYKQKYGNIDFAVMEITVFQTQLSFQAWCGAHAFDCNGSTTVKGYQAFYSTDVDPEAYSRESYIIYGNGTVVVFEFDKYQKAVPYGQPVEITDNSQYEPIFDNIVNSIQFSK